MTIGQAKAYQQKVNEPLCLTDVYLFYYTIIRIAQIYSLFR